MRLVAAFSWVLLGFPPKEYNEGGCSDTREANRRLYTVSAREVVSSNVAVEVVSTPKTSSNSNRRRRFLAAFELKNFLSVMARVL